MVVSAFHAFVSMPQLSLLILPVTIFMVVASFSSGFWVLLSSFTPYPSEDMSPVVIFAVDPLLTSTRTASPDVVT